MILEARKQGYRVVAVDGSAQAPGFAEADAHYLVSTRDEAGVLDVARAERVDAITYMITESPLRSIRYAAHALGLPSPSAKSVEATQSKVRMREILEEAGLPNAGYRKASSLEEAMMGARDIGLPLVVKSADVGGQLGLHRIETVDELASAVKDGLSHSVSAEIILEEWLDGPEINVVAVVLDGVVRSMTVSDRIKHPTLSFGIVHRHIYPAACSDEQLQMIASLTQASVSAMEISNGIVFPQMILCSRGPILVETGERIPGGVMKELFEYATGIDLVRLQLDISLGQQKDLEMYRTTSGNPAVTVQFLNSAPGPLKPGKVAKVTGREQALAVEGVVAAQFYNNPLQPQEVRPLRHARDRFYYIVAVGESRDQVLMRSKSAADMLDFLDTNGESLRVRGSLIGGESYL
jgi:biotin carboxylase